MERLIATYLLSSRRRSAATKDALARSEAGGAIYAATDAGEIWRLESAGSR